MLKCCYCTQGYFGHISFQNSSVHQQISWLDFVSQTFCFTSVSVGSFRHTTCLTTGIDTLSHTRNNPLLTEILLMCFCPFILPISTFAKYPSSSHFPPLQKKKKKKTHTTTLGCWLDLKLWINLERVGICTVFSLPYRNMTHFYLFKLSFYVFQLTLIMSCILMHLIFGI